MTEGLDVKESNAVVGFIKDFIAWVKSKVQKLGMSFEDVRLQRLFAESVVSAKNTVRAKENTTVGGVKHLNIYRDFVDWSGFFRRIH